MRLYLPMTLLDLDAPDGLHPAVAHAATGALAAALPEEDEEGLEFAAMLVAADASLTLLAADEAAPRRRVVVVADVAHDSGVIDNGLPSEVEAPAAVPWSYVVSVHIDDVEAEADVAAAAAGDAEAIDRVAERYLLWYDASELETLRSL